MERQSHYSGSPEPHILFQIVANKEKGNGLHLEEEGPSGPNHTHKEGEPSGSYNRTTLEILISIFRIDVTSAGN